MRKNGIDRTLTPIDGGVCAPVGFRAGACRCGFSKSERDDVAIILTKRRYPAAFVGTNCKNVGAHVALSEKHLREGWASSIVIHGGRANDCGERAEKTAESISRFFAAKCKVDRNEMILATTGAFGERIDATAFESGIKPLLDGVGVGEEYSLAAANVLSADGRGKQCAFSFKIGDVSCKIGAIYHASMYVGKSVQSSLCFLTTDVKISAKMLQKALKTAANEHFYMLSGVSVSPNDCVGIIASGAAENWEIADNNSDYQKFVYALCGVLELICREIAADGNTIRVLYTLTGAKSKNRARAIAKHVAYSQRVQNALSPETFDVQELIYALFDGEERIFLDGLSIALRGESNEVVTFEDRRTLPITKERLAQVFQGKEIEVIISLKEGNYTATAYGSV